jgi:hypothetical protein
MKAIKVKRINQFKNILEMQLYPLDKVLATIKKQRQ